MMEPRLTILGEPDKRSAKVIDLTDMTFGRLTVVGRAPRPAYYARKGAWWLCRCECGKEVAVDGKTFGARTPAPADACYQRWAVPRWITQGSTGGSQRRLSHDTLHRCHA